MAKKNFYAVRAGRQTGIFSTWDECKRHVTGFADAKYKGFVTLAEAEAFMDDAPPPADKSDDEYLSEGFAVAYVDGSYDIKRKAYGFGAVILRSGKEPVRLKGSGGDPDYAAERNVAGECLAAQAAIAFCRENDIQKLLIKHDYEGIGAWAKGDWKANKRCSTEYVAFIKEHSEISILFQKVSAHSGVLYNEEADRLAKEALGIKAASCRPY